MRPNLMKAAAVLAVSSALTAGGVAYASTGGGSAPVKHAQVKAAESASPDTDNIQSGDQTTPDAAAKATAAETGGESSGSEVSGNDGPGGHADEPANSNADHQFQGQE
ncbi:MAG TPA: hypothetical protein VGC71_06690 [Gaiellales bacterium]